MRRGWGLVKKGGAGYHGGQWRDTMCSKNNDFRWWCVVGLVCGLGAGVDVRGAGEAGRGLAGATKPETAHVANGVASMPAPATTAATTNPITTLPTSAPATNVTTTAPASMPVRKPLAVHKVKVDLSTPRAALKTVLLAEKYGDEEALRQGMTFEHAKAQEWFDLLILPQMERMKLVRAAATYFNETDEELVAFDLEMGEQLDGIEAFKVTQEGRKATIESNLPPEMGLTTRPATPPTTPPTTTPTTMPATEKADKEETGEEDEVIAEFEQDKDNLWHIRGESVLWALEDEELPSLRHSVPAIRELYKQLALQLGTEIKSVAELQAKLEAGEQLIMGQTLEAPELPATLPSTLPSTLPGTQPAPELKPDRVTGKPAETQR